MHSYSQEALDEAPQAIGYLLRSSFHSVVSHDRVSLW